MGDDVDFYEPQGFADPKLVRKFAQFKYPPKDAELLARILDQRCWHLLNSSARAKRGTYPSLRGSVLKKLTKMRAIARDLEHLGKPDGDNLPDIFLYSLALNDAITERLDGHRTDKIVGNIIAAVGQISDLPLRKNLTSFAGRQPLDEGITEIVRAVRQYWNEGEETALTAYVGRESRKTSFALKGGAFPNLVFQVLEALDIKITMSELETHISTSAAEFGQTPAFRVL